MNKFLAKAKSAGSGLVKSAGDTSRYQQLQTGQTGTAPANAVDTTGTAATGAVQTADCLLPVVWALVLVGELLTLHMCIKRAWAEEDRNGKVKKPGVPLQDLGARDANYVIWGMTFLQILTYGVLLLRRPIIASGADNVPGFPKIIAYGSLVLMVLTFLAQWSMGMTFLAFGNENSMDWIAWATKGGSTMGTLQVLANETGNTDWGPIHLLVMMMEYILGILGMK